MLGERILMQKRIERGIKSVQINLVMTSFPAEYGITIHYTDGTQQESSADARNLAEKYINYLNESDKKRILEEVTLLEKAFPKKSKKEIQTVSIDAVQERMPAGYHITIHYTDGTQQKNTTNAENLAKLYINYLKAEDKEWILRELETERAFIKTHPSPPYLYTQASQELQAYVDPSKKARIKSGAWNHHHITLVSDFLKTYVPLPPKTSDYDVQLRHFLEAFKTTLKNSSREINPEGALSGCIKSIQKQANVNIINIEEINQGIRQYQDALNELSKYSRYRHNHSKLACAARFFTLAWNRKNIDEVDTVLRKHKDPLYAGSRNTEQLLNDLNEALRLRINKLEMVTMPDYINPNGHLAKAIAQIQGKAQLNIISIEGINGEIDSKLQERDLNNKPADNSYNVAG